VSESVTVKAVLLKDRLRDFIVMINNIVVNITGRPPVMSQNNKSPALNKDLHLRLDEHLDNKLQQLAAMNHLKKGSFARAVLLRHINDYIPDRGFY
jgi:hypothetical protein